MTPAPRRAIRVAYLNPAAELGGGERSLLTLIAAVRKAEPCYVPSVILLADGPLRRELRRLDVPVHVVKMPTAISRLGETAEIRAAHNGLRWLRDVIQAVPGAVEMVRSVRSILADLSPSIVHSNGLKTHLLSPLWVQQNLARPVVWHVRDFLSGRKFGSRALQLASRGLDQLAVVANSRSVAVDVERYLPRGTHVCAIHNAVDLDRFTPDAAADPAVLPRIHGSGCVRVGLVATYARWKGQDCFIEAISRLPPETLEAASFYIVGGPIYQTAGSQWTREELQRLAARAGVAERLAFVDFVTDPAAVYRALDVVVHASTQPEPFGLSIAEAMACGRAVIVSAAGGAKELFLPGISGLSVVPADAAGLAVAMSDLIRNPLLRNSLGASARARAESAFTTARLGHEVARVYRMLLR